MKIHGIMLVKNEADIIEYTIEQSRNWCDSIYVYDNGSTDDTWDIVQRLSSTDKRIVPFKQDDAPFRDALRGEVFRQFSKNASTGDWWCRLDADEVYIDDPRTFLQRVPTAHHVVWSLHYQYYLTKDEAAHFADPDCDPSLPRITESNVPKYFRVNGSEARFFRHRSRLRWGSDSSWPDHMGVVHSRRIRLRHYQYRSPAQIQVRLDTRRVAASQGWRHFDHSLELDWREKLVDRCGLEYENSTAALDGASVCNTTPSHMEPKSRRLMKQLLHGCGYWP